MRSKLAIPPYYIGSFAMYTMKHPIYSIKPLPFSEHSVDAVPRTVESMNMVCGRILTSSLPLVKTHEKNNYGQTH